MTVKFIWRNTEFEVEADEGRTFLDLALIAGIEPPYSCLEGHCGACEAVLSDGSRVKTCQTLPKSESDVVVNYDKAQA